MLGRSRIGNALLEIIGALVGGYLGYLLFGWIASQGFYAMMVPGGLLGLGGGLFAREPSRVRATLCALAALLLGLFTEWAEFPFVADGSLGYFIRHVNELKPLTFLLIALGGALAFYLSKDVGWLGGITQKPST